MIIKRPIRYAIIIDRQGDCGVFDTMEDAIRLACTASEEYYEYTLSRKNEILNAVTEELKSHLEELRLMTCKENNTCSHGNIIYKNSVTLSDSKSDNFLETKSEKNIKTNNYKNSYIVNGLIISPSDSIETIIKNIILILKAGNAVVLSSNQNLKHVLSYTVKLANNAIKAVSGPKNLIVTVKEPSIENTHIMIEDEKITLIPEIDTHILEKIAL